MPEAMMGKVVEVALLSGVIEGETDGSVEIGIIEYGEDVKDGERSYRGEDIKAIAS